MELMIIYEVIHTFFGAAYSLFVEHPFNFRNGIIGFTGYDRIRNYPVTA